MTDTHQVRTLAKNDRVVKIAQGDAKLDRACSNFGVFGPKSPNFDRLSRSLARSRGPVAEDFARPRPPCKITLNPPKVKSKVQLFYSARES